MLSLTTHTFLLLMVFVVFQHHPFHILTDTPPSLPPASPKKLNLTTITTNVQKESVFQCWQLAAPFIQSTTPGTTAAIALALGKTSNASYTLIPGGYEGGLHHAPAVQYVALLAGEMVFSLPNSTGTVKISAGCGNTLILATDTKDVSTYGHDATYPSEHVTVLLQIPLENGTVPTHVVLHDGACRKGELEGGKG